MDLSAATWRKSSRSGDNQGNCIEVAAVPSTVAIRDSKNPEGEKLFIDRDQARMLSACVKSL